MTVRVLCVLLSIVVLEVVLCDAQTAGDEPHMCLKEVNQLKTKVVIGKCSRTSRNLCRRTKKVNVKANVTVCCEGWVFSEKDKCIPKCDRGCKRGTCIAPDTCACELPLVLKHNISCEEPICNPPCVNATCVDDNKCTCSTGFTQHNATHCAPICPEGFANDPHTLECHPHCDKCINGNCTAPNICTCSDGYILANSTCVPYCTQPCKNGLCVAPNSCECSIGYSMSPSDKSVCDPICETTCINANCVKPNKCICHPGYEHVSAWECKPKCDNCNHGECVAPNQCHCSEGYSIIDGQDCTPVCTEPCTNGKCSAPNTCTCNEGYELDSKNKFKCEPVCTDGCVNSTCTSPETCICYSGFEKVNSSVCRPLCTSCENGVCVAPETCLCNDGFGGTDGKCSPICSFSCINGFCVSPEKCACNEGYLLNETDASCYKPCIGDCANGKCSLDGQCLCDGGYELYNNTCIIPDNCDICKGICSDDSCRCEDGRPCTLPTDLPVEAAPSTSLAGLQMTWLLGACVGIFLMTIAIITIGVIWKKRKEYGAKSTHDGNAQRSILYTVPNTLIQNNYGANRDYSLNDNDNEDVENTVSLHLLEEENGETRR